MFDLCGICCGHFLLPFWEFFGAVLIGKAVFKVVIQVYLLITVFSKEHREELLDVVEWLVPGRIPVLDQYLPDKYRKPPAEVFHSIINEEIAKFQEGLAKRAAGSSVEVTTWWGLLTRHAGLCFCCAAPPPPPPLVHPKPMLCLTSELDLRTGETLGLQCRAGMEFAQPCSNFFPARGVR